MRKVATVLSVLSGFIFVGGCDPNAQTAEFTVEELQAIESLRELQVENAVADARSATASGDSRLLGVYRYSRLLPGVPDDAVSEDNTYVALYGYKMIEGTSDAIFNNEFDVLNDNAWDYAEIYNMTILSEAELEQP